jgi:hypothetical protein
MEVEDAELLIRNFAAELTSLRETAADATRKAGAISKIVSGYLEMFPELRSVVDDDLLLRYRDQATIESPKGAEAVRLILQASPNQWFWVSELVEALRARGWLPDSDNPANAVRTALERLVSTPDSDVRKGRSGENKVTYSYRPDDEAPEPPPRDYGDEEPF